MKGSPMIRQLNKYVNARSQMVFYLLFFALLISGCTSSRPPEFQTGLVFPGSENTVSLGGFWFNIEGGGVSQADKITPNYDPIGGYLFLYWIDDKGNVCNGLPGVSGQPGAAYVKAYKQQAWDAADINTAITDSQMLDLQKIPYSINPYLADTQASGPHFVQYGNRVIRSRDNGIVYRLGSGELAYSVPLVMSVDTTNTLFPYHPDKQAHCNADSGGVPLPSLDTRPTGQNPDMCTTRALPAATSLNYQESLNYCLVNLPKGKILWWFTP
jgi:hypothetical protein